MKEGIIMNTAILIPAYEPDEKLIKLVSELQSLFSSSIYVIDDGSSDKCADIFNAIEKLQKCRVIHHDKNMGKGAALKTGFKAILNSDADIAGCITVDADGQHLPSDILKVIAEFEKNDDTLILGVRDFNKKNVPPKSKMGNKITRAIFKFLSGKSVSDTQTGLRAISRNAMEKFLDLSGDRYEYEMNMLMEAAKSGMPIKEVIIQTVYIDNNRESHFNPILDSFKIYKEIFKFGFSSTFCSAVDIGMFSLVYWILSASNIQWSLLGATAIARIISSGINFSINKKIVFQNKDDVFSQATKYYTLVIIQMFCSWLILEGFTSVGLENVVALKVITDTMLFMISYSIQRLFIFGRQLQHEKTA